MQHLFTEKDYQSLTGALAKDLAIAVNKFCATDFNHDVYAVSVVFEWQYPNLWLCVENEISAAARIKAWRERDGSLRLIGVQSDRFSSHDFGYTAHSFLSETTCALYEKHFDFEDVLGEWDDPDQFNYHGRRFEQLMFETVAKVAPLFAGIRQTRNFIGYAMRENTDLNHTLRLFRSQIKPALFDRVFPEYRRERELLQRVASLAHQEQADLWKRAVEGFAFKQSNEWMDELRNCTFDEYLAVPMFYEKGLSVLPVALELIERLCESVGKIVLRNEAGKPYFAYTSENYFLKQMIVKLSMLAPFPYNAAIRLQALMQLLVRQHGMNALTLETCALIAQTLHNVRQDLFPKAAKCLTAPERLINFEDFGIACPNVAASSFATAGLSIIRKPAN
jgi:hypothetical protein